MATLDPIIIANPHAGQKAGIRTNAANPADLQQILRRHEVRAELWLTEYAEHGTELARRAAHEARPLVIAAGGDGTVAEVAAGLVGSETSLGVLPLGSVMNLARMLGIPRDLEQAAAVIKDDVAVRIDVGRATTRVGQRYFLEAAGAGMGAALFAYSNQIDSGNWKSLRPLIRYLVRFQPPRMQIIIDGQRQTVRAAMATVANGPFLGMAFEVAPEARLDDGQLTVRIFSGFDKLRIARQLWAVLRSGKSQERGLLTRCGSVVEIVGRRPLMVHADAHSLGTTPARFEILPKALSVVVPRQPDCDPALLQLAGAAR